MTLPVKRNRREQAMCGGAREESPAEERDGKRGSERRESGKAEFGERDGRGVCVRERERDKTSVWGGGGKGGGNIVFSFVSLAHNLVC